MRGWLRIREAEGRPTWLLDTPDVPFAKGHLAWDENTAAYVDRRFQRGQVEEPAT